MASRRTRKYGVAAALVLSVLAGVSLWQALLAQEEPSPQKEASAHERPAVPPAEELARLPRDGGAEWNRLVFEHSPYLLQHAANPVDWWPWGEAAFEEARRRNVPVFLSIGYATCHWCHVMERESFENPEVAALMNETFVSIKVDREERPDIDAAYMAVTQAMTGSGGWPMTVVLTPDKKPFFAGTYFPKEGGYGRPGMMQLIPALDKAWREDREKVLESANQIVAAMQSQSKQAAVQGGALNEQTLETASTQLASRFDPQNGGFSQRPKFPVPHNIRFLLRHHARTGDTKALEMAEITLREMREGGIYDHVGFGFHRYSTDALWLVPHFEKMLYDQALLTMAYTEAWQATGKGEYRQTAEEILQYVTRDMTAPEAGFYSAEDADSEGEEGLFYLWSSDEIKAVLGKKDGELWASIYNVNPGGNFRDEATGERSPRNILHLDKPLAETAEQMGMTEQALRSRLDSLREKLLAARSRRIRPLRDDNVLTDWNGLMISAYARAAQAFDNSEYAKTASRAADFVLKHMRTEDGRLLKRWRNGHAGHYATLEDYAFFIGGLLDLYETTFDPDRLRQAIELANLMREHFSAPEGGYFLAPDDGEDLFMRTREIYDGAIPSGNSVAALDLLRLARMTGDMAYEETAWKLMNSFASQVGQAPSAHTQFMLALDFAVGPSNEIVIAGDLAAPDTQTMLEHLRRPFLPNKVVLLRPSGDDAPIKRIAPYTENQVAINGKATAYVCRNFACNLPTTDIDKMLELIQSEVPAEGANFGVRSAR
ncbi:MAG: DUF255 domain-containing protein [bacterium]|nr:DUF255 domain-containing protein [bacterium]